MTNHRFHLAGSDDRVQGRCSCKQRSTIGTRSDAEMWGIAHLQEVERIRTHLRSRTPSLKSQHAWFCLQAENSDNDPDDRVLWLHLANEIEAFLTTRETIPQDPLF